MPVCKPFAQGWLLRPLLEMGRDQILAYAQQRGLSWVDDPTNHQTDYSRNFLRQQVIPLLATQWPGLSQTVPRAASFCAQSQDLLESYLSQDLENLLDQQGSLEIAGVSRLSLPQRQQLLRQWFAKHKLMMPTAAIMGRIEQEMFTPREDARPQVAWQEVVLCRHRGRLYLRPQHLFAAPVIRSSAELLQSDTALPYGLLQRRYCHGQGLSRMRVEQLPLTVYYRQAVADVRLPGRKHRTQLKKMLQDLDVPYWERPWLPLLFQGDELVALPGYWHAPAYAPAANEAGVMFDWQR